MKLTLSTIVLAVIMSMSNVNIYAAPQKASEEARKEATKKSSKDAKKEAKKLAKEGWLTTPGALPLEKQLDRSYALQYEMDTDGAQQYLMAEAMSIGEVYDAAKVQALELAKQNLASQIQTELTAEIESTVSNHQMEKEDAASIANTVSANRSLIVQSLGRINVIMEAYRTLPNKNKEVLVRIAYNSEKAKSAAKKAIKDDMMKRGSEMHKKLQDNFGW